MAMGDVVRSNAHIQRMRLGIRAGMIRRAGPGLLRPTPARLIAVLCASAFGPLLVAGPGLAGAVAAGIGVLGSVGAGVLTEVVVKVVARFDGHPSAVSQREIEHELAARIEEILAAEDSQATALRVAIAEMFKEVHAVPTALDAVAETGDRKLQGELAMALVAMAKFREFRFILTDVSDGVWEIQETLRRQDAEQRAGRASAREQAVQLQLLREDLAVIEQRTRSVGSVAASRTANWEGCPYRGLWPFEEDHARIFYGREQTTAELVASLAERLTGPGMLVVTGASGAGKSSLLRAGLLPALARGSLMPSCDAWPRLVMTPTATPLEELATHLAVLGRASSAAVHGALSRAPRQAHMVVRQLVLAATGGAPSASSGRLILVVDQFEEVFTLVSPDATDQRAAFLDVLNSIANTPAGPDGKPPALVVLGIRGDFWDRCAAYPQLITALSMGPFIVGPMTEPELRRAINGPADAAGLAVEQGLTETILGDLRGTSGANGFEGGSLPLLSQATLATWEHSTDGQLTSRGYGLAGGVAHAVQTSAEAAYRELTDEQREISRGMFLRLTVVARDGQLARRRMLREDLYGSGADDQRANVDAMLNAFAAKRLIILNEGTAEIAHDVFLYAWPRLRGWLDDDQADRALYSQLIDDAAMWHEYGRVNSFLYRDTRLAAVVQATAAWSAKPSRYPDLPGSVVEFLSASKYAANRSVRIRRIVAVGLVTLTVAAGIGAVAAGEYAAAANRQHAIALSRQLTTQSQILNQSDPVTARRLAGAAWHLAPSTEARDNITSLLSQQRGILVGHTGPGTGVAFSPDSRLLATTSTDYSVRLWDPLTGRPVGSPLLGHTGAVYAVAFSPNGRLLATTSADYSVRLWDPGTRRPVGSPLMGHTGTVYAVAFSPNGQLLATAGADYSVRLWDPATGRPIGDPLTGHTGPVYGVAFSPDGRMLASASADRTIRLWDPRTGHSKGELRNGHSGTIYSVAFSPDGRMLASSSADGTVRLWDPVTGHPIGDSLTAHTGPINALAFSPDGGTLVAAGADRTVRMWNPHTGGQVGGPLTGHAGAVNAVAFSPDGRLLASSGDDFTVRLWDPVTGRGTGSPITGHMGTVYSVAFSPDGRTLASTSADGTVRQWDSVTGRPMGKPLTGHTGAVTAVVFSPDGRTLATAGDDYTVRLWASATGHPIGAVLIGHTDTVYGLAFSPDGRVLASASADHTIRLWDAHSGHVIGKPLKGHTDTVYGVAFSPDGHMLASVSADTTVRRWNPDTGAAIGNPLAGHTDWVTAVAFSPDGRMLATTSTDRTIRLWDPSTAQPIGKPLTGHAGPVNDVAFSPDDRLIATAGADRTVRLWDSQTGGAIGSPLIGHTGPVTAVAFGVDGTTVATASYDRTIRLWDPALYADPLASICTRVGSPTRDEWKSYAPGEALPRVCG
jgi:WD40 repeat protein